MARCGEISLRNRIGGVITPVATDQAISGHGEAVLLIHGYNNAQEAARESYDQVFTHAFQRAIHVFWRGEIGGDILNRLISMAITIPAYPWQIPRARESGKRLAEYLRKQIGPHGAPISVTVIAHSLGCRLVFEMLRDLANNPAPNIRFKWICLMAPAIPVRLIDLNTIPPQSDMEGIDRKVMIFHSVCDLVLSATFPAGQHIAWQRKIETEYYPEAVGLRGAPFNVRDLCHYEGAGHSDYWESKKIARLVALRLGHARPRPLLARLRHPRGRSLLRRHLLRRHLING
jgi:esterase/lipase superfamily enzyme